MTVAVRDNLLMPNTVLMLSYSKTGTKWIWNTYFKPNYPYIQTNVLTTPRSRLHDEVGKAGGDDRTVIVRNPIEDGPMGGVFPDLVSELASAFPDARVVVNIRSQRSICPSHYGQYIDGGGRLGFKKYLSHVFEHKWHYMPLISSLFDTFGKENVFVYLFEDFRDDPGALLERLHAFIGDKASQLTTAELHALASAPPMNPRRPDLVQDTMLWLNRLNLRYSRISWMPEMRRPGRDHIVVEIVWFLAERYRRLIGRPLAYKSFVDGGLLHQFYAAENVKLADLLGRNLKVLGYPM